MWAGSRALGGSTIIQSLPDDVSRVSSAVTNSATNYPSVLFACDIREAESRSLAKLSAASEKESTTPHRTKAEGRERREAGTASRNGSCL